MSGEKSTQNRKWGKITVLLCVIVIMALLLQVGILYDVNTRNVNKTSKVLLDQVISIIKKNQQNEKEMIESLKEDCIVRAKACRTSSTPIRRHSMIRKSCRRSLS